MKFIQLQIVKSLLHNGFSISRAAQQHYIVQSAVSRQLGLLEQELGSPLFERKGKRLTGPTPLCISMVSYIDDIEQSLGNIRSLAEETLDGRIGELKIATTHLQAKYFLPDVMNDFIARYPKVKVHFLQGNPHQLVQMLHEQEADVAICTEDLAEDPQLINHECYEWNHALIVKPDHPLATGDVSLERVAQYPILTYVFGFTGRSKIYQAFSNQGLEMNVTFSAMDTDVIKSYVRLGYGVGIIAKMAWDSVADDDLVLRDMAACFPSSMTRIAYLHNKHIRDYVADFIELNKYHGALRAPTES